MCTACHNSADHTVSHCVSRVNKHSLPPVQMTFHGEMTTSEQCVGSLIFTHKLWITSSLFFYIDANKCPALAIANMKCLHGHVHGNNSAVARGV